MGGQRETKGWVGSAWVVCCGGGGGGRQRGLTELLKDRCHTFLTFWPCLVFLTFLEGCNTHTHTHTHTHVCFTQFTHCFFHTQDTQLDTERRRSNKNVLKIQEGQWDKAHTTRGMTARLERAGKERGWIEAVVGVCRCLVPTMLSVSGSLVLRLRNS